MRKLSTIDESFWGDVHKRSIGDDVRKEDDINVLDFDTFYQYLQDRYKTEEDGEGIIKKFDTDCIHLVIPIEMFGVKMPKRPSHSPCRLLNFTYSTQNEEFSDIIISNGLITIYPDLVSELEKNFELKDILDSQHLKPKADKITNQMVIDLIDTCLAKVDNPILIKESFWGDVHKRSIGNEVRKEDDINLLDKDGLYEYLISHYKPVEGRDIKNYISCGNHYIHLCIFIYRDVKYSIRLDIFNCRVKVRTPYIKRWPANLLDMIYKKYNREDIVDENRDHMTFITPKEGKGNNQFYIDFLDMILNNVDKPLLEKVINESFWGDVHRRSIGDEVRKEDERHKILERLLATYIKLFAESCYNHDEYISSSYIDFKMYIQDFRNHPRIEDMCPDDSYFDDLLDYVNKKTWNGQIADTIKEMTNRLNKGEHPITNEIIEVLRKHNVNESFWGDVHKRSIGNEVRKEDDVNFLDFDGFFDYLKERYRVLGKFKIHIDLYKSRISVPLISNSEKAPWCINLEFEINKKKENHIVTPELMNENFPDICSKLEEQFNVEHNNGYIYIHPKDNGQITNRFYVEILDFVIDNCGNKDEFILIERKK